jgi:predicted thioesterase
LFFFLHTQKHITTEASIAATIGSVMAKILATPLLLLPVNKMRQSLQDTLIFYNI